MLPAALYIHPVTSQIYTSAFLFFFFIKSNMLLKCNFSFFLPLFHQAPYPSFFCAVLTTGSPSLTSTVRPFLEPVSIPWPKKASFFPCSHLNQPPCKHIIVIKNTVRSILNIKQQLNKITDISTRLMLILQNPFGDFFLQ